MDDGAVFVVFCNTIVQYILFSTALSCTISYFLQYYHSVFLEIDFCFTKSSVYLVYLYFSITSRAGGSEGQKKDDYHYMEEMGEGTDKPLPHPSPAQRVSAVCEDLTTACGRRCVACSPCCACSTRFHIALLSSIGFCISFGIRCNMGVAVLQMTNSDVIMGSITTSGRVNVTTNQVSQTNHEADRV